MTYVKPLNVMDVNAIHVNMLTLEKKEKLSREGCCFGCKKQGHISCKCPKKGENNNAPCRGNQGMTTCMAAVEAEDHQSKVEELAEGIKELGKEERKGLLDLLMERGF